jgi:hypothetical protein
VQALPAVGVLADALKPKNEGAELIDTPEISSEDFFFEDCETISPK